MFPVTLSIETDDCKYTSKLSMKCFLDNKSPAKSS